MATDPFANLKGTADFAELADACDLAEGLAQPFDGVPEFDLEAHPEIDVTAQLSGDRAYFRRPSRRLFVDYRANADAYRHLEHLPGPSESLHGVISGRYALWDLVPALIERTGR